MYVDKVPQIFRKMAIAFSCQGENYSPFFAEFIFRFNYIEKEEIGTAAVSIKNGVINFYICPSFFEKLTPSEVVGVFIHEVLHLVNLTFSRGNGLRLDVWNMATDIANNKEILESRYANMTVTLPEGALKFEDIVNPSQIKEIEKLIQNENGERVEGDDIPPPAVLQEMKEYLEMNKYTGPPIAEPIYNWFLEVSRKEFEEKDGQGEDGEKGQNQGGSGEGDDEDQKEGEGDSQGQGSGNQKGRKWKINFGFSDTVDNHSELNDGELDVVSKEKIKEIVQNARQKGYGNMPGSLTTYIDNLFKERINWRKQLKSAITNLTQSHNPSYVEDTWKKLNRRDLPLPGKQFYSSPVLICLDVSGSTFNKDTLEKFFSEIEGISKNNENTYLLQADTEVQSFDKYKKGDWKKITLNGGGGTAFQSTFDFIKEKKLTKMPVVFLTDGIFDHNIDTYGTKIVWCIADNPECAEIPGGKNIHIESV